MAGAGIAKRHGSRRRGDGRALAGVERGESSIHPRKGDTARRRMNDGVVGVSVM